MERIKCINDSRHTNDNLDANHFRCWSYLLTWARTSAVTAPSGAATAWLIHSRTSPSPRFLSERVISGWDEGKPAKPAASPNPRL